MPHEPKPSRRIPTAHHFSEAFSCDCCEAVTIVIGNSKRPIAALELSPEDWRSLIANVTELLDPTAKLLN
jgi:hypothetical protein